jgi:alcohol dehydrogenase
MITAQLETPRRATSAGTMHALVYHGPGQPSWELHPRPSIQAPTDVVVRITTSTICGSDLHILKGDVSTVAAGRILGHEGIGVIDEAGAAVSAFHKGDRVLISCITACAKCDFCRKRMFSHCRNGGWILGNTIDGTQAEYVRIPYADTSLYPLPPDAEEEAAVMLSDILPTGFECGALNGHVQPGDTIAIVGAGPVGLSALMTSQFYSPARIFSIDLDDNRLQMAKSFGATALINSSDGAAVQRVMELTQGEGVDVAIEAVRAPRYVRYLPGHRGRRRPSGEHRSTRQVRGAAYGETVGPQHHADHPIGGHRHHADVDQGA